MIGLSLASLFRVIVYDCCGPANVSSEENEDDDDVNDKHDPVDGLGQQVPAGDEVRVVGIGFRQLVVHDVPLRVDETNLKSI